MACPSHPPSKGIALGLPHHESPRPVGWFPRVHGRDLISSNQRDREAERERPLDPMFPPKPAQFFLLLLNKAAQQLSNQLPYPLFSLQPVSVWLMSFGH